MTGVVVVGAGLAGLAAAIRLAQRGAKVTVVAKGAGGLHLSPGTIDVLGYAPNRVEVPPDALPPFVADHPDHPYARLAPEPLREADRGGEPGQARADDDDPGHTGRAGSSAGRCSTSRIPWKIQSSRTAWRSWSP